MFKYYKIIRLERDVTRKDALQFRLKGLYYKPLESIIVYIYIILLKQFSAKPSTFAALIKLFVCSYS